MAPKLKKVPKPKKVISSADLDPGSSSPPTSPPDVKSCLALVNEVLCNDNRRITTRASEIKVHLHSIEAYHNAALDKIKELELQVKAFSCSDVVAKSKIQELQTKVEALTNGPPVQQSATSLTSSMTFAQATVKSSSQGPIQRSVTITPSRHVLHVFPRQTPDTAKQINSSETTRQLLVSTVDVSKLGVGIVKISKSKDHGITVTCRSETELGKLSSELSNHSTLTSQVPPKKAPVISVLLQGKDIPTSDIPEKLVNQNPFIPKQDVSQIKVLNTRFTPNGNTVVIIRLPPTSFRALADNNMRLAIHYSYVTAREQDPTLQCRNCFKFGHKAVHCLSAPNSVCFRCSDNHNDQNCSAPLKCTNCARHNELAVARGWSVRHSTAHSATDLNCPSFIKARQQAKLNIDYGF